MRTLRRRTALAGAAAIIGSVGAGAAVAATPSAPAWATTATQAYHTFGADLLGAAPAGQQLNLVISLAPRNQAAEAAALKAMYTPGSETFHQFLTPAQFTAAYGPTTAAVDAVTGYLAGHGFTNISVLSNHMAVTATANVAQVTSAFHTVISNFRAGAVNFYANSAPALIPSSLSGVVTAVLGLNNVPFPTPHPVVATKQAGSPNLLNGVAPQYFQNTYGAAGTPTGSKTPIAILTEGNVSQVYKDLALAEKNNKLPAVSMSQINVGPQSTDTSGQDEFDLDTQSSTAMAQTVSHVYLYNIGSLVDSQIDLDFATFVAQDKAPAMSASIGGCDIFPWVDGSMVSTDQVLQEGAMQGQSLFASSGDNGDGCAFIAATGVPSSFPGTNWPASGEFTTAVGGTTLVADTSGNRIQEIGWIGSGGGISETENPGWWTQDTDPGFSAEYVNGGRAVPDVGLDADPYGTPANIYVSGSVEGVGGTSLASPLMLGSWARMESAHANRLGFAAIDLYAVYDKVNPGTHETTPVGIPVVIPTPNPAAVPGFTDITLGTNGLYPDLPGYDEVTGLGAPNLAQLNKVIP
ncbi:MAG TPA: protease pro-enzyme activation domain-containing protein [Acidimicrobiales bacterium]|nr:protease pro-enzyme activation domain-containing protein [Acidimicrobiales bacterium]